MGREKESVVRGLRRSFGRLTAADCNAWMELPVARLGQAVVELATDHANALGVGWSELQGRGVSWVLLRLSMRVDRLPAVGQEWALETWVSGFNSRFSTRDFALTIDGEPAGNVSTVWTIIDSATRRAAPLDQLGGLAAVVTPDRRADVSPALPRVRPDDFAAPDTTARHYRVALTDLDSNRHLTAMRYVDLFMDMLTPERLDAERLYRLDLSYSEEARYDDALTVEATPGGAAMRITRGADTLATAALAMQPRL